MSGGDAGNLRSQGIRMGQPHLETDDRPLETAEGTGGTETSNVPRGKESIPEVAASEPGGAQTQSSVLRQEPLLVGGWTSIWAVFLSCHMDHLVRRTVLEEPSGEGERPVAEAEWEVRSEREYRRTRGIRWEAGVTTLQG